MLFTRENLGQANIKDLLSYINNSFIKKSSQYQLSKEALSHKPDSEDKTNALAIIDNLLKIAAQVKKLYDATQNIAQFFIQGSGTRNANMAIILDGLILLLQMPIIISGEHSSAAAQLYREHLDEHSDVLASIAQRLPMPEKLGNYLDEENKGRMGKISELTLQNQKNIPYLDAQIKGFQSVPEAVGTLVNEIPVVEAFPIDEDDELIASIEERFVSIEDEQYVAEIRAEEQVKFEAKRKALRDELKKLEDELRAVDHALWEDETFESIQNPELLSKFSPEFKKMIQEHLQVSPLRYFPFIKALVNLFTTSLSDMLKSEKERLLQKKINITGEIKYLNQKIEKIPSYSARINKPKELAPAKGSCPKEEMKKLLKEELLRLSPKAGAFTFYRNAKINALDNHMKKVHQATEINDDHFREAKKILQRPDQFFSPFASMKKKETLGKLEKIRSRNSSAPRI